MNNEKKMSFVNNKFEISVRRTFVLIFKSVICKIILTNVKYPYSQRYEIELISFKSFGKYE